MQQSNPCAVVDCENAGRPQVCPYDGRYHHHGMIHYQDHHPAHPQLRFRPNGWFEVCDPHYAEIKAGVDALPKVVW